MNTVHTRRLFLAIAATSGAAGIFPLISTAGTLAPGPMITCLFSLSIASDPGFVLRDVNSIFGSGSAEEPQDTFPAASQVFFFCALVAIAWLVIA
jgi:hypothetical protein